MRTTTEELEKARAQIRGLEEEVTRAKEYATIMANMGQNTSTDMELVTAANVQSATPEPAQAVKTALETGTEQAQEIVALRDELASQEAFREKEREPKKTAEEERQRVEENLRKSQENNDRLKEERRTRRRFGGWQKQRMNGQKNNFCNKRPGRTGCGHR